MPCVAPLDSARGLRCRGLRRTNWDRRALGRRRGGGRGQARAGESAESPRCWAVGRCPSGTPVPCRCPAGSARGPAESRRRSRPGWREPGATASRRDAARRAAACFHSVCIRRHSVRHVRRQGSGCFPGWSSPGSKACVPPQGELVAVGVQVRAGRRLLCRSTLASRAAADRGLAEAADAVAVDEENRHGLPVGARPQQVHDETSPMTSVLLWSSVISPVNSRATSMRVCVLTPAAGTMPPTVARAGRAGTAARDSSPRPRCWVP